MSHSHENVMPRPAMIAAIALVGGTLGLTALVQLGVLERSAVPATARERSAVQPVQSRELAFADRSDGAVVVADAGSGKTVALIETETKSGGFVRGVLRGMARDRRARGLNEMGAETPFTLTLWSDGGLSLRDSATDRTVELGAFGPDNRAVFMGILAANGA